jgi:hypothetical protein
MGLEYPDFSDIGRLLREKNPAAYRRLDRLFELGIFLPAARNRGFDALVSESMVLDLSQLPSDAVRNSIAQIVVLSAHAHYNAQGHVGGLRQLIVFDEAHRVLGSAYIERFVREARAYGVGVVLSSQNPSDFPPAIAASLSTKIIHGNDRDRDRVRAVQGLLGDSVSVETISGLGLFEALVSSAQHRCEKIRTFGYPHLLLYEFLLSCGDIRFDTIPEIDGLDYAKLSLQELIEHLLALGLVNRNAEILRAVPLEPR